MKILIENFWTRFSMGKQMFSTLFEKNDVFSNMLDFNFHFPKLQVVKQILVNGSQKTTENWV